MKYLPVSLLILSLLFGLAIPARADVDLLNARLSLELRGPGSFSITLPNAKVFGINQDEILDNQPELLFLERGTDYQSMALSNLPPGNYVLNLFYPNTLSGTSILEINLISETGALSSRKVTFFNDTDEHASYSFSINGDSELEESDVELITLYPHRINGKTVLTWNKKDGVTYELWKKQREQDLDFVPLAKTEESSLITDIPWGSIEQPSGISSPYAEFAITMLYPDGTRSEFLDVVRNNDQDQDGLSDEREQEEGTDLLSSDTDSDGLSDYLEIDVVATDPTNPDSDGDGYNDGLEIESGTDPLDVQSIPVTTCEIPLNGDWVVYESCWVRSDATVHGSVTLRSGITLTLTEDIQLLFSSNEHVVVNETSSIVINHGATIIFNRGTN